MIDKLSNAYILKCDKCGNILSETDNIYICSNNIKELKEFATQFCDWKEMDNKTYCASCSDDIYNKRKK